MSSSSEDIDRTTPLESNRCHCAVSTGAFHSSKVSIVKSFLMIFTQYRRSGPVQCCCCCRPENSVDPTGTRHVVSNFPVIPEVAGTRNPVGTKAARSKKKRPSRAKVNGSDPSNGTRKMKNYIGRSMENNPFLKEKMMEPKRIGVGVLREGTSLLAGLPFFIKMVVVH